MLGNVVTGCSVLAPAGMLAELSQSLGVTIGTAGLLITFGAIVLCAGSPVTAWLTSRIERRVLLTATLLVLALTNAASAFAPDYDSLLVIRLVMLAVGVLYTPQAAGTAALIVPAEKRGSTIAYVFLGWSLAAAIGLPLITFIASRYGFRTVYGAIALTGFVSFVLLWWRLPGGLLGAPVDLKTWLDVGRNPMILLLLLITTLQMSGQFVVFTFMGPLLTRLTGASPDAISLVFALYGIFGFIGIAVATRIVDSWGAWKTSVLFAGLMLTGVAGWALSAGAYALMAGSVAVWGLGFASTNSMQQVRLVGAAPALASATVSLNTSVLYIGQAVGSAIGGLLFAREWLHGAGYVAAAFIALALALVIATQPRRTMHAAAAE
ncbi:MFS transporter [Bradyrhizobium jicamae]|uniref:MFS transporter n=1 Tax=Bradyrhizobium jicamae TaxID=280332 RepID=A0ABS5FX92_9BRAD|nr:MFS transporter [Bradyrhizobium jicamae]MBR0800866.1 MFS transporter [Bradyrhizobium jicamae]MBR0934778.1 MFS transporter [Bradyrhizobium jicamae]